MLTFCLNQTGTMSIIPEHSIEEIRGVTDIVDVVGEYVQLKKRSSNFVGLCPFHNEKTPSFNVNPRLGIFKCFGCGEGGDVFSFVSRMESLSFPDAVRVLAEKAGIVLPEDEAPGEDASESEAIYHALRFSARFFHERLAKDANAQIARDYIKSRGFSKESIKKFGIGYAPDEWDSLLREATDNHVSEEFLEKSGMIIPRKDESGFYDRYRHRLIFPIFSHVGKVVGFGGRILNPDDQPKYINSPETKVYSKSHILYGLYHSKNAIRGKEEAILVEGYTDVVSLHQAGVEHVVASSGTALTKDQIRSLARYAKTIILLYDADSAGLRAALRGIDLILEEGLIPYAVRLPDGDDPDSFVQKNGAAAFEAFLREHRQNFIQFVLANAKAAGSMDSPEGIASVQRTIIQSIGKIPDELTLEAYIRAASKSLDIPDNQIRSVLKRENKQNKRDWGAGRAESQHGNRHLPIDEQVDQSPALKPIIPAEKKLLRLMLEIGPTMIEFVMSRMAISDFTAGPARLMAEQLVEQYQSSSFVRSSFISEKTTPTVRLLATEVMTLTDEPSENWGKKQINVPKLDENPQEAAGSAMKYVKKYRLEEQIEQVKRHIKADLERGNDATENQMRLTRLFQLRKQLETIDFLQI